MPRAKWWIMGILPNGYVDFLRTSTGKIASFDRPTAEINHEHLQRESTATDYFIVRPFNAHR